MYKFFGKTLIIEEDSKRILVVSDLHLGYGESLHRTGFFVPNRLFQDMFEELEKTFIYLGQVDEVVILGDLKHVFGSILGSERQEVFKILSLMKKHCSRIIIIKGNHDAIIEPLARDNGIEVVDYYIWGTYAFLHGDRDFSSIYDSSVKIWVVGHAHPAITLYDSAKNEKYKCFLVGSYKQKKVIVLPSFFSANEGSDVCSQSLGLVWPLDVKKCNVYIIGEDFNVLDFGPLKKLC